ncbi:MAG: response regulator [Candidatus Korobacteraceae bacterium]|jgi:CheY-like chemotaxis protein
MPATRILFVDDDPGIQVTLPKVLEMHGYEVVVATSIPEALNIITSQKFDVLISDLNMGHAADGFTVVHAMRRINPNCINFILTGFPAFESALQALRSNIDDYFTKPSNIPQMLQRIEESLKDHTKRKPVATLRLPQVLRANINEITTRALGAIKSDPPLAGLPLSDSERLDPVAASLRDLADHMESGRPNDDSELLLRSARLRGETRYKLGCPLDLMVQNERLIEQVIKNIVYENLLNLNLSYLLLDLERMGDALLLQLQESIRTYMQAAERSGMTWHREAE